MSALGQNPGMSTDPPRVLPLQGATNFRDLGGYPGHGGRPLRWRRLFRADHPGGLTPADHQALKPLQLARAFDFRGQAERAATPYALDGVTQHSLAIEPTVAQRMQDLAASGRALTVPVVTDLMKDLYRGLVHDQSHRFAELFHHLLENDPPSVFHCTAGKDRTGFAAALILLALGVSREVVMQDYLLTNEVYRRPTSAGSTLPPEALAVLWQVQPAFLDTALQAVEQDHGGMEKYLTERIGLTPLARARLAERYLEPA